MIYFIINNDFHETIVLDHIKLLDEKDICIVRIPYKLSSSCQNITSNIHTFNTPYKDRHKFWNPLLFYREKKKINSILFSKFDTVILLTEYDPLNLYVAYKAKQQEAKVILLEEGIATYYTGISNRSDSLSFRNHLKLIYLRYIIGLRYVSLLKKGESIFLQMEKGIIDTMCIYYDIPLKRELKVIVIKNPATVYSGLIERSCIFLSQPLYEKFTTEDEYLEYLEISMSGLSSSFGKLIFKFHPRESSKIRGKINIVLKKYSNVHIVTENIDLDASILKYKPKYAVSFFSDSLFKLAEKGLTPIFIFHLFSKLKEEPVLKNVDKVLILLTYQYVRSFHITKTYIPFVSNKNLGTQSLSNIISGLHLETD